MTRPSSQSSWAVPHRAAVSLSEAFESRLRLYAVGAGVGSLGLFTLAQPARAQIVFTPVNVTLKHGRLPIDLNHDGVTDFNIVDRTLTVSCCFYTQVLRINGNDNPGASVVGERGSAAALTAGKVIGPGDHFLNVQKGSINSAKLATAFNDSNSFFYTFGQFANTASRFLGLKFVLSGQTHYGWAEFTFVQAGFNGSIPYVTARVLGYAHDTVPNQTLRAGQRVSDASGSDSNLLRDAAPATTLRAASLGLLALGSRRLNAWRRRETLENYD